MIKYLFKLLAKASSSKPSIRKLKVRNFLRLSCESIKMDTKHGYFYLTGFRPDEFEFYLKKSQVRYRRKPDRNGSEQFRLQDMAILYSKSIDSKGYVAIDLEKAGMLEYSLDVLYPEN